jgi:hypothetical protein
VEYWAWIAVARRETETNAIRVRRFMCRL